MKKNYWVLPEKKADANLLVGIYNDFMEQSSIDSMKEMAGSEYLGEGASRVVFSYKGYVVKIAKNDFGISQNLIERKTWSKYKNTPIAEILVPLVYTSADCLINIQEAGTPIKPYINCRRTHYIHHRFGIRRRIDFPFYDLTEQLVKDGLWEEDVYKSESWVLDKYGWPRICDYGYDEDAQWAFKTGRKLEHRVKPYDGDLNKNNYNTSATTSERMIKAIGAFFDFIANL